MDTKLELQLQEKYPQILQDLYGDPKKTCMCFGIECGDGWYDIIDKCCAEIMATEPPATFKAEQIKEKFGGLRFYTNSGSKAIYAAINKAEIAAESTCELCGKPGTQRGGGWIRTLCDDCAT